MPLEGCNSNSDVGHVYVKAVNNDPAVVQNGKADSQNTSSLMEAKVLTQFSSVQLESSARLSKIIKDPKSAVTSKWSHSLMSFGWAINAVIHAVSDNILPFCPMGCH